MYALPPLTLPIVLLNPRNYERFFQIVGQQSGIENVLMLGLFGVLGLGLGYCVWFAWGIGTMLRRTWQAHRWRQRGGVGFGLVLTQQGLVARLIDTIDEQHHCWWLPREAIATVAWQRLREQGAKHSRWVYRTRLGYITTVQGQPQHRWLTLRADWFDLGWNRHGDRLMFELLDAWWRSTAPPITRS
jgi:hypothetical protein